MLYQRLIEFVLRSRSFPGQSRVVNALLRWSAPHPSRLKPQGMQVWLDPSEWLQRDIMRLGGTEPFTTLLIERLLKKGDLYLDVGAHIGVMTLVARQRVGCTGHVIAIEPQPYNCDRILENWLLNGYSNLSLYAAAASDLDSTVSFALQPKTDRARLCITSEVDNNSPKVFVQTIRLDSIPRLKNCHSVKLLKVDVEGHELAVLRGLGSSIGSVRNVILELLGPVASIGEQHREIIQLLRHSGFRLNDVTGRQWCEGCELVENNLWAERV